LGFQYRQAGTTVAADENLRFPLWLNLVVVLLARLLGGIFAFWSTHRVDLANHQQDQPDRQLIGEGRMIERVWTN
jgi:hypothetical protein